MVLLLLLVAGADDVALEAGAGEMARDVVLPVLGAETVVGACVSAGGRAVTASLDVSWPPKVRLETDCALWIASER